MKHGQRHETVYGVLNRRHSEEAVACHNIANQLLDVQYILYFKGN